MPGLTQNEIVTEELAANELRFFALAGLPEDLVSQAGRLPVDRSEQTLGLNSSETTARNIRSQQPMTSWEELDYE